MDCCPSQAMVLKQACVYVGEEPPFAGEAQHFGGGRGES